MAKNGRPSGPPLLNSQILIAAMWVFANKINNDLHNYNEVKALARGGNKRLPQNF